MSTPDPEVLAHVPAALSYPAIALRPAVAWFAAAMEMKLRAREHYGDWIPLDPAWLLVRLEEELAELKAELVSGTPITVLGESVDVGNFSMMIADVFGRLGPAGFGYPIGRTPAWGPDVGPWEALRVIGAHVAGELHESACPAAGAQAAPCACRAAERLARRVAVEVRG